MERPSGRKLDTRCIRYRSCRSHGTSRRNRGTRRSHHGTHRSHRGTRRIAAVAAAVPAEATVAAAVPAEATVAAAVPAEAAAVPAKTAPVPAAVATVSRTYGLGRDCSRVPRDRPPESSPGLSAS